MSKCGGCAKGFSHNSYRVTCASCDKQFHLGCAKVTQEDYKFLVSENKPFSCDPCVKSRRKSRLSEASSDVERYQDLLAIIEEIRDEVRTSNLHLMEKIEKQAEEIKEFKVQFDKYSDHLDENSKQLQSVDNSLKGLTGVVEEITARQKGIDKELNDLAEIVNNVEQSSLEKTLEISGYPYDKDEDVMEIIRKIGQAIDYAISDEMIDDIYRIKPNAKFPGLLVVTFVRKRQKLAFYRAAREKRNLTTRSVGFIVGESTNIYVNNRLTFRNRKLLKACKDFKRQSGFKFVWVKNGQVFLKKDENSRAEVIRSAQALLQINKD